MRVEISADNVSALLPKYQRRLYEVVRAAGSAGIDSAAICERLYIDHPNGGPDSVSSCPSSLVGAHARQLNLNLAKIGLAVRGSQRNGYRLVRLEAAAE